MKTYEACEHRHGCSMMGVRDVEYVTPCEHCAQAEKDAALLVTVVGIIIAAVIFAGWWFATKF